MSSPEKIRQRRKLLRSLQTGIFRRGNILHFDFFEYIYSIPATAKPSKSSLRKATRQARQEKKEKQRAEARKRRAELQGSSDESLNKDLVLEAAAVSSSTSDVIDTSFTLQSEAKSEVGAEPEIPVVPTPPVSEPEVPALPTYPREEFQKTQSKTGSIEQPAPRAKISITPPPKSAEKFAAEAEKKKKRQNLFQRTVWTLIMIGGFIGKFFSLSTSDWEYDVFSERTVTFGACIHDPPRYGMPDSCISRSHSSLFPCNDRK